MTAKKPENYVTDRPEKKKDILVGTSGYSYKEWKGSFYPEDLPAKQFLQFYASRFSTAEINNTFYRLPTASLTEGWYRETPGGFCFALKLSQKITHFKRLRDVDDEMEFFFKSAANLKEKQGPTLVQLPPNFRKDLEILERFVRKFASGRMLAFEFRHDSWTGDDLIDLLRQSGSALAVVDTEKSPPELPGEPAGPFVYMRLRREEYTRLQLEEWARWISASPFPVYCYLKHDQRAPVLASQLLEALSL